MSGCLPYFSISLHTDVLFHIGLGELPARRHYKAIPQVVWDILVRCWIFDPGLRPTMLEVKEALCAADIEGDLDSPTISESKPVPECKADFDCSPHPSNALQPNPAQ